MSVAQDIQFKSPERRRGSLCMSSSVMSWYDPCVAFTDDRVCRVRQVTGGGLLVADRYAAGHPGPPRGLRGIPVRKVDFNTNDNGGYLPERRVKPFQMRSPKISSHTLAQAKLE